MTTTAEIIFELVREMPERQAAEVLDFAEFIKTKSKRREDSEDLADAQEILRQLKRGEETTIPWKAIKDEHGL